MGRDETGLNARSVSAKYDQLLGKLRGDYVAFRWLRGPKIHEYCQTKRSLIAELAGRDRFDKVLEIGCGPGTWTDLLSHKSRQIVAIDVSREMIRVASMNVPKNTKVICADFLSDSLVLDHGFDSVFAVRSFEYLNDKQEALRKARTLLKTGGLFCAITKNPCYAPMFVIRSLLKLPWISRSGWIPKSIRELLHIYSDELHSGWVSPAWFARILSTGGFGHVRIYPTVIGIFFSRFGSKIFDPLYWFFDHMFLCLYRRPLHVVLWPLVESYLISAVKIGVE